VVRAPRAGIEPAAARLLAESGTQQAFDELEAIATETIPAAWESGRLAEATAAFHRRMVELSGNSTLGMIAGMLHEITERHTAATINEKRSVPRAQYDKLLRSYRHLIDLVRARDGAEAEAHWRRHMDTARELMLKGHETIKVRDVME
jgi:DNA-binding FadR family transcriptional regulator